MTLAPRARGQASTAPCLASKERSCRRGPRSRPPSNWLPLRRSCRSGKLSNPHRGSRALPARGALAATRSSMRLSANRLVASPGKLCKTARYCSSACASIPRSSYARARASICSRTTEGAVAGARPSRLFCSPRLFRSRLLTASGGGGSTPAFSACDSRSPDSFGPNSSGPVAAPLLTALSSEVSSGAGVGGFVDRRLGLNGIGGLRFGCGSLPGDWHAV